MLLAFAMDGEHTHCVEDGSMGTYHARQPVGKHEIYNYCDKPAYILAKLQTPHVVSVNSSGIVNHHMITGYYCIRRNSYKFQPYRSLRLKHKGIKK